MTIELQEEGMPNRLPPGVAVGLFRVLQDAISHGIEHAGVRHLTVTMRGTPVEILVDIADGGVGFDPDHVIRERGLGLVNMRGRMRLPGGGLHLESQPGAGTRVRARVRWPQSAERRAMPVGAP